MRLPTMLASESCFSDAFQSSTQYLHVPCKHSPLRAWLHIGPRHLRGPPPTQVGDAVARGAQAAALAIATRGACWAVAQAEGRSLAAAIKQLLPQLHGLTTEPSSRLVAYPHVHLRVEVKQENLGRMGEHRAGVIAMWNVCLKVSLCSAQPDVNLSTVETLQSKHTCH